MILVDAYWDTRNLGVRTAEVSYELNSPVELPDTSDFEYVVAKVPAARVDIVWLLESAGFRFMECQVTYSIDVVRCKVPKVAARMANDCISKKVPAESAIRVFEEVRKGVFDTDRVALDPRFGIEKASERYIGWIRDEMERGCDLIELSYRGLPSGFYAMSRKGSRIAWPILGGVYKGSSVPGLGVCIVVDQIRYARGLGCSRIESAYSTNNRAIANVMSSFGSKIERFDYVLVLSGDSKTN